MTSSVRRHLSLAASMVAVVLSLHAGRGRWPTWSDDEVAILLQAGQLSGRQGEITLGGFPYDLGWTLALIPAWWLGDAPFGVYYWALAITVSAGVGLVFPLRRLAVLVGAGEVTAVWAAALIALLPARTVYSSYALLENFLALIVAWAAVAGVRYARHPAPRTAAILALAVAAALLTHQRTLGLAAATTLWFSWGVLRRIPGARVGLAGVIAGSLAAVGANRWQAAALYPDGGFDRQGRILDVLAGFDPSAALAVLLGQVWYHAVASFGLFALGLVLGAVAVTREIRSRELGVATWWCAAIMASLAIATTWVVGILDDPNRFDLFMYGRYSAPLMLPVSLVGLVVMLRGSVLGVMAQPVYRWAIAVLVTLTLTNELITRPAMANRPAGQIMNFPGLLAWGWPSLGGAPSPPGIAPSLLAVVVLAVAASAAARSGAPSTPDRNARLVVTGLLVLALAVGAVGQLRGVGPFSKGWRTACTLNDVVTRLDLHDISYDTRNENPIGYKMTAFCLAPAALPKVDSSVRPPRGLVIARPDWPLADRYGARLVARDARLAEALWVMPGPQQQALQDAGELGS